MIFPRRITITRKSGRSQRVGLLLRTFLALRCDLLGPAFPIGVSMLRSIFLRILTVCFLTSISLSLPRAEDKAPPPPVAAPTEEQLKTWVAGRIGHAEQDRRIDSHSRVGDPAAKARERGCEAIDFMDHDDRRPGVADQQHRLGLAAERVIAAREIGDIGCGASWRHSRKTDQPFLRARTPRGARPARKSCRG